MFTPNHTGALAKELRQRLEESRRSGLEFDWAWPSSVEIALATVGETYERNLWTDTLAWARPSFEAAYLRTGPMQISPLTEDVLAEFRS